MRKNSTRTGIVFPTKTPTKKARWKMYKVSTNNGESVYSKHRELKNAVVSAKRLNRDDVQIIDENDVVYNFDDYVIIDGELEKWLDND